MKFPDKPIPSNSYDSRFNAPWERPVRKLLTPFEEFIRHQTTGSIILFVCLIIALALANSSWAGAYNALINTRIAVGIGAFGLEKSLQHWVNEALMALFFFVVGLEIKRAILVGELSSPRLAALPIIAALGGMVVPALIYYAFNPYGDAARGWGIPMATDIAFAVGALALLGSRVPKSLVLFLVALAIVDDLGAVLIIALFYTDQIAFNYLSAAAMLLLLLLALNLGGIRHPLPYFLLALLLWLALLKSGVHATIAGVLGAFTVPARPKYDPVRFSRYVRKLMDDFDAYQRADKNILLNEEQYSIIQNLESDAKLAGTLLQRMEHTYHLPVMLLVIPLFALVNAGITVEIELLGEALRHPVTLGVIFGLVIGKTLGISGACWLALKCGIGKLPEHARFHHIIGASLLAGIGFTMSLFIAELGFAGAPENLLMAKIGILVASLLAILSGYAWLLVGGRTSSLGKL